MARHRNRRRVFVKKRIPPGAAPGTLVPDPDAPHPTIRLLSYGPDGAEELPCPDPARLRQNLGTSPVTWVDVDGLGDADVIARIGHELGIHPLALEDVLNPNARMKIEDYGEDLFAVIRMPSHGDRVESEQLAIYLGTGFVATFQGQRPGDSLNPVRERIHRPGRMRAHGADFLFYSLLDAVVDNYFPVLEALGDRVDRLEDQIVAMECSNAPALVQSAKHDLRALRSWLLPTRNILARLVRGDYESVSESTQVYLRDAHDHAVQLLDAVVTYREIIADLMDLHMSNVSNRMNDVMKFLTLIATVFIPLTFIVGIYGMNFDTEISRWNMPELRWRYGYPAVMLLMLCVAIGILGFFWRKGWLRRAV